MHKNQAELLKEFDRQVENLLQKNYPKLAGVSEKEFLEYIEPLRSKIKEIREISENSIPFVIVVKGELVPLEKSMEQVVIKNTNGHVSMTPKTSVDYSPIESVEIPEDKVYLLIDIDTGQSTLNITPEKAFEIIKSENHSPITTDEGVAIVTHFPEVLTDKKKYNCFSMLASRAKDKTVPAMWISYKKPRLGWCWNGNPHTWLGSASCKTRL